MRRLGRRLQEPAMALAVAVFTAAAIATLSALAGTGVGALLGAAIVWFAIDEARRLSRELGRLSARLRVTERRFEEWQRQVARWAEQSRSARGTRSGRRRHLPPHLRVVE